jgi:hypothetical protein
VDIGFRIVQVGVCLNTAWSFAPAPLHINGLDNLEIEARHHCNAPGESPKDARAFAAEIAAAK